MTATPSLLGSGRHGPKTDELKILSALQQGASASAVARAPRRPWGVALACAVVAGAGIVIWQSNRAAASSAAAAAAVAALAPAPRAVPASAAPAIGPAAVEPAASAALIETVAPAAMAASAIAQVPAAAAASAPIASSHRAASRHAPLHTASAKPVRKAAAVRAAPVAQKDPDVDLLEAMVAHVRGQQPAKKPADEARP